MRSLPHATEEVWNFLKDQPSLGGFILLGGTALAIRIQHRLSEDLDLAWLGPKLPVAVLQALLHMAKAAGFDFQRNDSEASVEEFAVAGMNIHDYQQDFLANGRVKVSFFVPDVPLCSILQKSAPGPGVRVATLDELFKSKCLVSATRSKTRDWLDLFLLMRDHGYTIADYKKAFIEAGATAQYEIGLSRICSGIPQQDDEGYYGLLGDPPSIGSITAFFVEQRDVLEVEEARRAFESREKAPEA